MLQDTASAETFTGHPKTDVTACSYSIDGSELATSGGDGSLKLWGGARGKEIMSFPGAQFTCFTRALLVQKYEY